MKKIATHDSATGEKPKNLLSWLMIPFARTQRKTIREQYEAGCRMFDIRVRFNKEYTLYCAHGLFTTKRTAISILQEINFFPEPCYVTVTYEGKLTGKDRVFFKEVVGELHHSFRNIMWGQTAVKYTDNNLTVDWELILPAKSPSEKSVQGFLPLDGRHWQTLIPIPWLWKKVYFDNPVFSDDYFTFVDFL